MKKKDSSPSGNGKRGWLTIASSPLEIEKHSSPTGDGNIWVANNANDASPD